MKVQQFNENWLFGKILEEGRQDATSMRDPSPRANSPRAVTLPHDAMIHEKRGPETGSSGNGYFSGGKYIYKKLFYCPRDWAEKTVLLHFGGVYRNAVVSLNNKELMTHAYGYSDFTVDLSGLMNFGADNLIEVAVDNSELPNSRWYSGSGIYRPVEIITGGAEHICFRGVRISTVGVEPPKIRVETRAVMEKSSRVQVEILDGGQVLARVGGEELELDLPQAELWSDENPKLYTCRVRLESENGEALDECLESFGIRKLSYGTDGFFVNGRETLLRGGCIHHDNGILGAVCLKEAEERRVRMLKEAGFNAIRSAHNPASRELLEACDKYGVYVMDETWDMWYKHKTPHDYAGYFMENYQRDLEAIVEKDYNHPCVIMYSIGNEVSEPAEERGIELCREMVDRLHELDGSRPVTAGINLSILASYAQGNPLYKDEGGRADESVNQFGGMNSSMFNAMISKMGPAMNRAANSQKADEATTPVLDALDIAGYNYATGRYEMDGEKHPQRLIVGSETFPGDIWRNWQLVKRLPYLIGDFMWVSWDYLGETGIGAWAYTPDAKAFDKPYPWKLADCGAMDILGDPNGELYLAQAAWGLLKGPVIAVRPVKNTDEKLVKAVWRTTNSIRSWSFCGCEGQRAVVEVYSPGEKAALFLNGRMLGKKRIKDGMASFKVKYAPGELSAAAYDETGKELGRDSLFSAVGKLRVRLEPEQTRARVGQAVFVPITLVGANGMRECGADAHIDATVEGGQLLALGSANPRTEESYDVGECTTYYGRAMAVVRGEKAGNLVLTVRDGWQERTAVIEIY